MLVTRVTRIVSPILDLAQEPAGREKTARPQERPVSFRHVAQSEPLDIGKHLAAGRNVRVGSERRRLIPDVDEEGVRLVPQPVAHVGSLPYRDPVDLALLPQLAQCTLLGGLARLQCPTGQTPPRPSVQAMLDQQDRVILHDDHLDTRHRVPSFPAWTHVPG